MPVFVWLRCATQPDSRSLLGYNNYHQLCQRIVIETSDDGTRHISFIAAMGKYQKCLETQPS